MVAWSSPLFIPALWRGDHFVVLDETLLPSTISYIPVRDVSQAIQVVREMKTRAFGQVLTFLYSAALLARSADASEEPGSLCDKVSELAARFHEARPTFDFAGLAGQLVDNTEAFPADQDPRPWMEKQAVEFAGRIVEAREARAKRTAALLPDPCRLLTHCNISGELVAVAKYCEESGKHLQVIATETRPYFQGSRLTAWELSQAGVETSVIPDGAVAQVMAKHKIDAVLVGSDRCAQNGDVVNKIGTYPLALAAKEYGIPFYALVQRPHSLATGEGVTIEERPVVELLKFHGRSLAPEGVRGSYPAFDVTPASLISRLVGFDGTFTPAEFELRYRKAVPATQERSADNESYVMLYGVPKPSIYPYISQVLEAEKAEAVLLPEMRPELWGVTIVAGDLVARGLPVTLITDSMMGSFFASQRIRRVLLSYTELREDGPEGICGSLLAVVLARAHGVPVEISPAAEPKGLALDADVTTFLGERVCPDGVSVHAVEREIIPWRLFQANQNQLS